MRPIDGDELVNVFPLDFHEDPTISMGRVRYIIGQMPTLHIRPVIYARWLNYDENHESPYFICSNCGHTSTIGKTNYCPICGAKMEKEYEMDSDS